MVGIGIIQTTVLKYDMKIQPEVDSVEVNSSKEVIEFKNELFRPMCILVSFRPWGFTTGCNFMGTKVRKICLAHNEKKDLL